MKPISFVRSLILGAAMSLPLGAQAVDGRVVRQQRDSAGVARAAQAFLVAFDSLRWEPFAAAWGPEATVFLPDAARPNLIKGRDEILRYFRGFFDDVRSSATSGSASLAVAAGAPSGGNPIARVDRQDRA